MSKQVQDELREFFNSDILPALRKLKPETRPRWGQLTAEKMLTHLTAGIKLSLHDKKREITTPPEKLQGMRQFLMSEKPFPPNRTKPAAYEEWEDRMEKGTLERRKIEFLKAVVEMQVFFEKNPEFTSIHPSFGELSTDMWMHLHRKHIRHHFEQFDLWNE